MNDQLRTEILQRADFALELAEQAKSVALDFFGRAQIWDKIDSSPVTEADLAIDGLIQKALSER